MNIRVFDPMADYGAVRELWDRSVGAAYPVSERVLMPRLVTRPTLEPGDGFVAEADGRVVGFALAEIDRASLRPTDVGTVQLLLVDPDYRRQGLGRALLDRLHARLVSTGCRQAMAGTGLFRFWSGVPVDLADAGRLFERSGYAVTYECIDMYGALDGFRMEDRCRARLAAQRIEVCPVTDADVGAVYDLMTREQPGWRASMLEMVRCGDMDHVLFLRCGSEAVGVIQTFSPRSRFRAPNLVWERLYGEQMGGFGAVLVAKAWRGRGLGTCICQAAAEHIASRGATGCFIDWTSHERAVLYRKVGTEICRTNRMYLKALA